MQDLLRSSGAINGEKLVIFTEHKDTLLYLEQRLTRNNGYQVATIHGGKLVEERRQAQFDFAKDSQILIVTDAAGEGSNLQFCKLLINWDISWNPNRLEQCMGRIHRYGQKQDVLVFNMVASNTKEGQVLEKLLTKLDIIREGIGDDRHQSAHYHDINEDEVLSAWLNMKKIAKAIGMSELKETLQKLQNDKGVQKDPSVSINDVTRNKTYYVRDAQGNVRATYKMKSLRACCMKAFHFVQM